MKRPFPRTSRIYLTASILAAVLSAAALFAYLQSVRSRIAQYGKLVPLVVAARDLEAGEILDSSSLTAVDFPDRYLLPGAFSDPGPLEGSALRRSLRAGEPLLESALATAGSDLAASSLDRGFRAYPLPASCVSFPVWELSRGSRVDVLAVYGDGAMPVLENVEVLGVPVRFAETGTAAEGVVDPSPCILLQLTSEEACRLAAAREAGTVEVLLRPAGEL